MADKFVRGGGKGAGEGIFADQVLEALKFLFGDQETMEVTGPDGVKRDVTLNEAATIGSIVGAAGRKLAADAAAGIAKKEAKNTASLTKPRKSKGVGSPAASTKGSGSPVPKKSRPPAGVSSVTGGPTSAKGKPFGPTRTAAQKRAAAKKKAAAEEANKAGSEGPKKITPRNKKTAAEKETVKRGTQKSREATNEGDELRAILDAEDASRASVTPLREKGAPLSSVRPTQGLKPTNRKDYGKRGRTPTQKTADTQDFIAQRLRARGGPDDMPGTSPFGGPVKFNDKGAVANPARANTVYKPEKPKPGSSEKVKAQYAKDLKDWQARQKPSTPTPKQALREDSSKQLGELRSRAPRKPKENASAAVWDKYRANLKKYEADQKRIAEDPGKSLKQIQKEADLARASNALGSPANKPVTPKPTPATPKATPKAPTDPAKKAAAQKKQPTKSETAAQANKAGAEGKSGALVRQRPGTLVSQRRTAAPRKTADGAERVNGAIPMPSAKPPGAKGPFPMPAARTQNPKGRSPILSSTAGGAKPVPTPKQAPGLKKKALRGAAGAGVLGAGTYGAAKVYNATDNRSPVSRKTDESGRIISRTKLRTDKYGRRITADENKKRDNFRDSRKRMSADRNEEARETEMDRRKKFRKTEGKKKFGKAATRITKDKSKLAGKGIRTKRSEEEKRQRVTYI